MASKMMRRLRRRRVSQRLLICLAGLCLIAATAAGLVWLMESFRIYSPSYYEPKDIERERFEMQRRAAETKAGSQRP